MGRLHIPRRDDRGSIPLAMLASFVVGALVITLFTATQAGQLSARFDRNFTGALYGADAGVQEAAFRLNAVPPKPTVTTLVGPPRTIGEATYSWTATRVGVGSRFWNVESESSVGGVRRRVEAVITERRRFFAALAAEKSLTFGGNNVVDSYNSSASPAWPGTSQGLVATNGSVTISGGGSGGGGSTQIDEVHLYNYAANPEPPDRCSPVSAAYCLARKKFAEPINLAQRLGPLNDALAPSARPYGPAGLTPTPCPAGPLPNFVASSNVAAYGGPGRLNALGKDPARPGEFYYYCFNNVTFDVNTLLGSSPDGVAPSAANPVLIYATGRVTFGTSGGGTANTTYTNCGTPNSSPAAPCVGTGSISSRTAPVSAALQILTSKSGGSSGSPDVRLFGNTKTAAAVYAPLGFCGGGSNVEFFGSLICNELDNVGNWSFHYDEALTSLGDREFGIARWREK